MASSAYQNEWIELGERLSLPSEVWRSVIQDLEKRYAEQHRFYHTVQHIDECWSLLNHHADAFDHPDWARLALLYHDAVYDPARQDNEAASAALLHSQLGDSLPSNVIRACSNMIMATQRHEPTGDHDTDMLVDIDMSILAAPADRYREYAEQVAAEYVPLFGVEAYRFGRRSIFLEPTLSRSQIFSTAAFRTADKAARSNLMSELAGLTDHK